MRRKQNLHVANALGIQKENNFSLDTKRVTMGKHAFFRDKKSFNLEKNATLLCILLFFFRIENILMRAYPQFSPC